MATRDRTRSKQGSCTPRGLAHLKIVSVPLRGENALQILVPPTDTTSPEVIRVYHDECSYASHEGALYLLWIPKERQAKYKKPRGQTVRQCAQVKLFIYVDDFTLTLTNPHSNCNPKLNLYPNYCRIYLPLPWHDGGTCS